MAYRALWISVACIGAAIAAHLGTSAWADPSSEPAQTTAAAANAPAVPVDAKPKSEPAKAEPAKPAETSAAVPSSASTAAPPPASEPAQAAASGVAAPIDVIVPPVKRVMPKPVATKPAAKDPKTAEGAAGKDKPKSATGNADKPASKTKPKAVTENTSGSKKVKQD